MASRCVALGLTLALLCVSFGVEATTDADKAANRLATQQDFKNWVATVEANHLNATAAPAPAPADATVAALDDTTLAAGATTLTVGSGGYDTVQAAVDAVVADGVRVIINILSGTYEGHVTVSKGKTVTFNCIGYPTMVYGDTAGSTGSTSKSATVQIYADSFIAYGCVFKNSAPPPQGGAVKEQGVALLIVGDMGAFFNCQFLGAQDTLYDSKGRHYFKNCFIQGSIDFICGDGQSIYQSCTLNSIANPDAGSLTAQKRTGDEATGFVFVDCSITGTGPIYLGRAWGPNSRTVFIYCNIADIILPEGWYDWGDSSREQTVFYGQYQCTGPGADEAQRVDWSHELTASEAYALLSLSFIGGSSWVPAG